MKNFKRTALILVVGLSCLLAVAAQGSNTVEVVTDGEGCFVFKHEIWVNDKCFKNYSTAKEAGDMWFKAWEKKRKFNNKTWRQATPSS